MYVCLCVPEYTTWEACVSYIGVVVPAENGVRRPPIGLPLAGPGVARCSHRFRQSLADSAPAAILNDSGINTRGAEKKVHAGPPLPPVPSAVSHNRSISVRTLPPLSLALSIYQPIHATTDTVAPPPLSTQGHPNAFPPPTTPLPSPLPIPRYRSSSDGIPGATTPTIDDPVEGGDRTVYMCTRGGTHACTHTHTRARKSSKKYSAKAGLP